MDSSLNAREGISSLEECLAGIIVSDEGLVVAAPRALLRFKGKYIGWLFSLFLETFSVEEQQE